MQPIAIVWLLSDIIEAIKKEVLAFYDEAFGWIPEVVSKKKEKVDPSKASIGIGKLYKASGRSQPGQG